MKLFIEPVDVWMFRDGRPFDAGSDHRATSLFPPHPSVIQGVLRSHHLVVKGVDISNRAAVEAAVGTATTYRWHPIRGPFVARREEDGAWRYHPLPTDAIQVADDGGIRAADPVDPAGHGVTTDSPTPLLLWLKEGPKKPKKGEGRLWLREDRLRTYLDGDVAHATPEMELLLRESRFGIGRDDRVRAATEGLLYEVVYVRPREGVGLEVEIIGLRDWPDRGILRMGGEARAGLYCPSDCADWPAIPDPLPERFRLYLATPACFQDGWRPRDLGAFFEGKVELAAAAVGRFDAVGGYDMARGQQKPSRRYVPAGSVYYFRCGGPVRWRAERGSLAFTEDGAQVGYGQFLIGRWRDV